MGKPLTEFGLATLKDRYLLDGETPTEMFKRVADAYSSDKEHAKRMFHYISNFWFMPATPILSNAGTDRGLPISCYLNKVGDSLQSIAKKWNENVSIASKGGGIGTCWSDVRGVGEPIKGRGGSSGVIPFIKVVDSLTLAISQGSLRRGSSACYLHISHPEVEEFLEIRKPSGDFNRKSLNLHHGIVISDKFMHAVELNDDWELISPHTKEIIKKVNSRELFQAILDTRIATGEPYIIFEDTINNARPSHHKKLGLKITQSNLCAEITLPTGLDHHGKDRTAVCCLGSVNAEYYNEWKDNDQFIEDCLRYLDGVLSSFIEKTKDDKGLANARYSVIRERSVGLGLMGLHSYLQKNNIPFESLSAKTFNKKITRQICELSSKANEKLAHELGACLDAQEVGEQRRFSYTTAIAPTASISIIAGGTSPCIEPLNANIFTQKTLTGSFEVRNKYLTKLLKSIGKDTQEVWDSIIEHHGSVQHLEFLTQDQKDVFKTAFEIDQWWLVNLASDRAKFIDQSQSINLFLNADVDKWNLLMLHLGAWRSGVKSLYYLRSRSVQRASFVGGVEKDNTIDRTKINLDDCLVCQ